jgi:hypothetical protein
VRAVGALAEDRRAGSSTSSPLLKVLTKASSSSVNLRNTSSLRSGQRVHGVATEALVSGIFFNFGI